jgi:hypothetical protein
MIRSISGSDDLAPIVRNRRTAVIVDTCSAIDILRVPGRYADSSHGAQEIQAASFLIEDCADATGQSLIMLPYPVITEIADHKNNGLQELRKAIEIAKTKIGLFSEIQSVFGQPSSIRFPENELVEAGAALERLFDSLVNNAICIEESQQAVSAAHRRVVAGIAPAKRGGQQWKDCTIVEHILEIAPRLRDAGCQQIILISSNKNDFCDERNRLREPLASEFNNAGITYVRQWQAARGLISRISS